MIEFLFFVGGIIVLFYIINLNGRVHKIEKYIKSGALLSVPPVNYQSHHEQPEVNHASVEQFAPQVTPLDVSPDFLDKFSQWIKEDWLIKLGALLLIIGFGWLTTYAFLNNWIGPMGRITLGIVAGVVFLSFGAWRIKNYLHQGGIFLVLGSTTILMTTFAARSFYGFFDPFSSLTLMFLSTAFVAFISVKYRSFALSLASLILAGIAPLLTNSATNDYVGLFSYLLVVILGTIWVTAVTGKRQLTTAALVMIVFYSFPHLYSFISTPDRGILLLFAYAFSAVFFVTNTLGILKLKDKEIVPDLVSAAGNGLLLLSWIMVAAPEEWKSLIISAWMIIFAVGAFMIFMITKRREPFYVYAGVGIMMLVAATSVEMKGATLTIAYAVESGIISLITYFVLKEINIAERMSLLLIGPFFLSLSSVYSSSWNTSFLNEDFFVLLVMGITLLGLGLFFGYGVPETKEGESRRINVLLLVMGSLYFYALIWLSLPTILFNQNNAVMVSLVIYTIIGLIFYFYGMMNGREGLKKYGGFLVGFVAARLFLVDVWNMEMAGKIMTFFLIGALLVSTAFLGKKKKAEMPV